MDLTGAYGNVTMRPPYNYYILIETFYKRTIQIPHSWVCAVENKSVGLWEVGTVRLDLV